MNNRGSIFQLPVVLLMLLMVLAFLVGMIPAMTQMIQGVQASNSLNCPGYNDTITYNHKLDYNGSQSTNTLACMAISLYVPYIVLGVLIASVAYLFGQNISFGGMGGGQQQGYY